MTLEATSKGLYNNVRAHLADKYFCMLARCKCVEQLAWGAPAN